MLFLWPGTPLLPCAHSKWYWDTLPRDQVWFCLTLLWQTMLLQVAQGPKNPVDLNSCRTHQFLLYLLSRSATAEGTIIVQGLTQGITGGASWLFQSKILESWILLNIAWSTTCDYLGIKIPVLWLCLLQSHSWTGSIIRLVSPAAVESTGFFALCDLEKHSLS